MAHAEQDLMERLCRRDRDDLVVINAEHAANKIHTPADRLAKEIYFSLLRPNLDKSTLARSRVFLSRQLDTATYTAADMPDDMNDLQSWVESNAATVGGQYRQYLKERQSGAARRYFTAKSHALHFLKAVAPTKLVDGAWLYGLTAQWRNSRYFELIRIYLEELGEGDADKNHVLIYKKLLAKHECTHWQSLDDTHFVQGAIQLSLAQHASGFLPEVIGFNLGYEQLPLHLLICAYELNELDIDPYYFTLHVTIDNAATGHAAKAVKAVADAMPHLGDRDDFYQRIRNGYQLNSLGAGTNSVIARFDIEQELCAILASKAEIGAFLHSDYCRIAGKTVNEWLAKPGQIRSFLDALQKANWIRRREHPEGSRFWQLLEGEKAPMFGVFNAYERQVIYDWIADDSLPDSTTASRSYKVQERMLDASLGNSKERPLPGSGNKADSPMLDVQFEDDGMALLSDDFNIESHLLNDKLAGIRDKNAAMDMLVQWMSPVYHHTPAGLMATRIFAQRLQA